ncbi:hypothetical protein FNV43_RR13365 [Rhamnella rubrinervis]|uniref:Uncharacterized protein n=1 Tax=Rhamnella rubrinervis TaxID=2594499 RepID=A0A8K0MF29_9ROSA|nr:hypothetical protein FNV43_RR13365 [Rhamnella rubrinervis]
MAVVQLLEATMAVGCVVSMIGFTGSWGGQWWGTRGRLANGEGMVDSSPSVARRKKKKKEKKEKEREGKNLQRKERKKGEMKEKEGEAGCLAFSKKISK